jgi:hypothetical protein
MNLMNVRHILAPLVVALVSLASASYVAAQEAPETVARTASGAAIDFSDYVMAGINGGRGDLPEVKLWFRKSLFKGLGEGGHGWSYPASKKPDDMHYSSWVFWQCGVSDGLLQLISNQATDPSHSVPHLGRYFIRLSNSGITAWSDESKPPVGLEIDISNTVPITESCRSDDYLTYGVSNNLYFQGGAKYLLTVDKNQHLDVDPISSTLPNQDTHNLTSGLEALSGHPLFTFPDYQGGTLRIPDKVQFVAEFQLRRTPGKLKLVHPSRKLRGS